MNERIQELAVEAYELCSKRTYGTVHSQEEFNQKFAELIVRECAQVSEDDITDGDACCTNTAYRSAKQIKKHFGVES